MLLEDELGQVNLIVPPEVYERNRALVRGEPLLLARGRFERIKDNKNIVVDSLESLGPLARRIARATSARRSRRRTTSGTAEPQRPAAVSAPVEQQRRVHEPDVRERLREVADQAPERRSYSSASRPRSFRSPSSGRTSPRLVELAEQDQAVDEPERAEEERALARRQAVDRLGLLVVAVALHEAVRRQLAPHRLDRAAHARVVGRQEADERDHQQARVERASSRTTG